MHSVTPDTSSRLTFKEIVRLLRELHDHEWKLRTAWMQWFLLVQGILFAALAQSVQKDRAISVVVCVVGFATCVSTITAFKYSSLAIDDTKKWWKQTLTEVGMEHWDFPAILGLDHKATDPFWYNWIHHLLPWRALPRLLLACWIFLGFWVVAKADTGPTKSVERTAAPIFRSTLGGDS